MILSRILLPFCLCLPLLLSGCGGKKTPQNGFQVALLTTGPVTDGGWNQSAEEGLQRVEKNEGAHGTTQESLDPSQFASAFRDFASRNYRLIFAHGDEFGPTAEQAAAQFPNTVFVTTGGDEKSGRNVAPIIFETEQGTYLQGMEAAMVSKTGKGGYIIGQDFPPVERAVDAFEAGAKAINPNFQLQTIPLNSWSDTAAAKTATQTLLNSGVDVIGHNCDAASAGMFETANGKPGVYVFGVNADENSKASNVLSSAFLDVPKVFDDVAHSVKTGVFSGQPLVLGMKQNDVRLIDNPKLQNVIPAAGRAKIQAVEKKIVAGTFDVLGPS